jgi:prepilin-type N-terminal cleavage/methylation domain-containing protein
MLRPTVSSKSAFTLIELLTVMTVIAILAGLVLSGYRYAQDQGARKRAEAEIQALSVALESYKADNGDYPRGLVDSGVNEADTLDPRAAGSAAGYQKASLALYAALSGDGNRDRTTDAGSKVYFEFKASMLLPRGASASTVDALVDPWTSPYGYSTMYSKDLQDGKADPRGFNPTFDLWSTAGDKSGNPEKWVTNW